MAQASSSLPGAVLWDLDGTLYRQAPLRKRMLWELGKACLRQSPARTGKLFRWLKTFRHEREELRALGRPEASLDRLQFEHAAQRAGAPVEPFEALIREWMWNRPLPFLAAAVYDDVEAVLKWFRERSVPMGVFSDYPVTAKLEAMGLAPYFSVQISATDPEVNAFKPHPQGFLVGAERLGVPPSEVLFIGDRMDVDGMGAKAAGMEYRILDRIGQEPHTLRNYREFVRAWNDEA